MREAERLRDAGAGSEARRLCEQVLRAHPDDAAALNLLAALAADEANFAEGARWAQRAIELEPRSAAAHYTLGRLLQAEGRLAEAEAAYGRSLELEPRQARAHNNLGCVLHMQGKLEPAIASYRAALQLDPALPQANQNLASITRDRGALEQAVAGYRRQTAANPADAEAWNNLGNVYRELGLHREAIASFAEAIARNPGLAEARYSRSFELLLCGDYLEGWKEYEWRWKVKAASAARREFRQPLWDGRELPAGTLLLHAEQGFGDTLQFARYAAPAARRCRAVVLECQPELASLLGSVAGLSRVVPQGAALPPFDAQLPLMSLPRVFGTTLESVPWEGAYVRADPARARRWDEVLLPGARRHVGLAWAGRPQQWDDRKRSITLATLAPLAAAPGIAFYSLQKGEAAAQAAAPPPGLRLTDSAARIEDFADTAALMSRLDLVITIDTSVAHLAGAMGVPVWVLVAHAPDWRYHLEREDNPWYPSMRLFRQQTDGDWSGPIGRAAAELAQLAAQ